MRSSVGAHHLPDAAAGSHIAAPLIDGLHRSGLGGGGLNLLDDIVVLLVGLLDAHVLMHDHLLLVQH